MVVEVVPAGLAFFPRGAGTGVSIDFLLVARREAVFVVGLSGLWAPAGMEGGADTTEGLTCP